jgi:TIR domain
MNEYDYDVFISYKRGGIKGGWISEIFLPLFEEDLSQNLGRRAKIFLDTSDIQPGAPWPQVLADTLAKSTCLVAILNPLYFTSDWCVAEFSVMYHRQNKLREENALRINQSLLAPFIRQGPTRHFPSYASQIQLLDYSKYNRIGEAFVRSDDYDELQKKITQDAALVAESVEKAPKWDQRFKSQAWIFGPFNFLGGPNTIDPKQPKPSW